MGFSSFCWLSLLLSVFLPFIIILFSFHFRDYVAFGLGSRPGMV